MKLVCVPAHWHRQAGAAAALAARLKKGVPGVKTVLGGYTASRFAGEILRDHPAVDFVVRGDGELPLLRLLGALGKGPAALARVPNLAWRNGGKAVLNRVSYAASSAGLGELGMEGLALVLNKDLGPRRGVFCEDGMFNYVPARGCSGNCSACGGGKDFHRKFFGRKGVAVKTPAEQAEDISRLMAAGFGRIQLPLDPLDSDKYRIGLLSALARRGLRPVLKMELCGLPSRKLLGAFSAAAPGSRMTVFAGSGSEKVRRLNRGRFYTNSALMGTLKAAARLGVNVWVTFTTGLPFETREDLRATADLIRRMRRELGMNRAGVYVFSVEPGSPLFESPDEYGVKLRRRSFADFAGQKGRYDMGYSTAHFTEREIVRNLKYLERTAGGG
ncbi:MAG: radical SAM protein [Elusimicrobiota bacterium]